MAEKPFGCGPPEGVLVHAAQNEVLQLRAQDSLFWQRHWVAQHLHRQTSSLTSLHIEYTLTGGEPSKGPDRAIGWTWSDGIHAVCDSMTSYKALGELQEQRQQQGRLPRLEKHGDLEHEL